MRLLTVAILLSLMLSSFVPAWGLHSKPSPIVNVPSQCVTSLCTTTTAQKQTYNPAIVNGLRPDLGKFSVVTGLTSIQWNKTNADYLQFNPPSVGPTALSNSAIYYNSTETVWQMHTGLDTIEVYVRVSGYSANVFIHANLGGAQTVCLPFKAPSIILHPANTTYVQSGREIFSWSDIPSNYSPTWNVNKLCLSLPSGVTIIDPIALDGSGQCSTSASNTCGASLTTTNTNDVVIVLTGVNNGNGCSAPSGASLTYTLRKDVTSSDPEVCEYSAVAASTISAQTITCTDANVNGRISCQVFGVSGANTGSPFDTATTGSAFCSTTVTVAAASASCSLTTTNANDMIIGLASTGASFVHVAGGSMTLIKDSTSGWGAGSEYQVVSTTQTGFSVSMSVSGGTVKWALIGDAIKAAAGTSTQGIKITLAEAGPSNPTIGISGCSPSNSTFTADGFTHTYTLSASCSVTLTNPAATTYTRYQFNISPHPSASDTITFTTCSTGTCSLYQNTTYYQLFNNYTEIAQSPTKWDGYYENQNPSTPPGFNDPTGTFLGDVLTSSTSNDLCFVQGGNLMQTFQKFSYGHCDTGVNNSFMWADYGTGCWPTLIGNTWSLQTACPAPTTGNNTYLGYYVQSKGGSVPNLWPPLAIFGLLAVTAIFFMTRRR